MHKHASRPPAFDNYWIHDLRSVCIHTDQTPLVATCSYPAVIIFKQTQVFVSADMTKTEQARHNLLVEQLKS